MNRLDSRDKTQFKKDIKQAHIIEGNIILRMASDIFDRKGYWPDIVPIGTDFTGEYQNKASVDPDFMIDGKVIEVTRSNPWCNTCFHEKKGKIDYLIKHRYNLVFVNGYKTESPKFVNINPDKLEFLTEASKNTFGEVKHPGTGFKPGYKYKIDWFEGQWESLPKVGSDLPSKYNFLIKVFV